MEVALCRKPFFGLMSPKGTYSLLSSGAMYPPTMGFPPINFHSSLRGSFFRILST